MNSSATSSRYAIFEYLQSVVKSGSMSEEQTESLEVAVQCVSEAFGFSSEEPAGSEPSEFSVKPLTLPVIFNAGMQVLSGTSAPASSHPTKEAPAAPEAASAPAAAAAGANAPEVEDSADSQGLFAKFVATLETRGFFAGLTRGTVCDTIPLARTFGVLHLDMPPSLAATKHELCAKWRES